MVTFKPLGMVSQSPSTQDIDLKQQSVTLQGKLEAFRVTKIMTHFLTLLAHIRPYKLLFNFGTAEDILVSAFVRFWPFGVLV